MFLTDLQRQQIRAGIVPDGFSLDQFEEARAALDGQSFRRTSRLLTMDSVGTAARTGAGAMQVPGTDYEIVTRGGRAIAQLTRDAMDRLEGERAGRAVLMGFTPRPKPPVVDAATARDETAGMHAARRALIADAWRREPLDRSGLGTEEGRAAAYAERANRLANAWRAGR